MTVNDLVKLLNARIVNVTTPDREVTGGYAGDFLSFVMGKAPEGSAWFTVMTNVNVAAVALLAEVAVIVCCEGSRADANLTDRVKKEGINLIETDKDIFSAIKAYVTDAD